MGTADGQSECVLSAQGEPRSRSSLLPAHLCKRDVNCLHCERDTKSSDDSQLAQREAPPAQPRNAIHVCLKEHARRNDFPGREGGPEGQTYPLQSLLGGEEQGSKAEGEDDVARKPSPARLEIDGLATLDRPASGPLICDDVSEKNEAEERLQAQEGAAGHYECRGVRCRRLQEPSLDCVTEDGDGRFDEPGWIRKWFAVGRAMVGEHMAGLPQGRYEHGSCQQRSEEQAAHGSVVVAGSITSCVCGPYAAWLGC